MKVEIITIGDEILIGQIVDTNSAWMGEQLNLNGFKVVQISSISDEKSAIMQALDIAQKHSDIVLITGGLGPTSDDITKPTLAEYFGGKLVLSEDVISNIKSLWETHSIRLNDRNAKQAEVPDNCTILRNSQGTAPGMWFEKNNTIFVSMPGVPFEMKALMSEQVVPRLKQRFVVDEIIHKTILITGYFEAQLAEKLEDWEKQLPEKLKIAYLPSPRQIRMRFTISGKNKKALQQLIDNEIEKLHSILPNSIFGSEKELMEEIVGNLLRKKNKTLVTAESCTGGHLAHLITSVSGSSDYFLGSVVAYSNQIKEELLGVKTETLEKHGAVSEEVVKEMAEGARLKFNSDYSLATSGIAGPTGATETKPVGMVCIALATTNGTITQTFTFSKYRERNIIKSSIYALNMLRLDLLGL